jgi:hypothetical protein
MRGATEYVVCHWHAISGGSDGGGGVVVIFFGVFFWGGGWWWGGGGGVGVGVVVVVVMVVRWWWWWRGGNCCGRSCSGGSECDGRRRWWWDGGAWVSGCHARLLLGEKSDDLRVRWLGGAERECEIVDVGGVDLGCSENTLHDARCTMLLSVSEASTRVDGQLTPPCDVEPVGEAPPGR